MKAERVAAYEAKAIAYAEDVIAGKVITGRLSRLACKRFLKDLERAKDPSCAFEWKPAKGAKVCVFLEALPHVQGPKAGTLLVLEPWQVFTVMYLFSFILRATGLRRFRRAGIWVARKNGKSILASGIALYMMSADGEAGAEVYCVATKVDQARKVFEPAQAMLRHPKGLPLRNKLGIEVGQHAIYRRDRNSVFKPLSSDGHTLDGLNVSCAILDELHAHRDRAVYDVVVSGMGARAQPLEYVISTAGYDVSGVGYETYSYGKKVLEGHHEDDAQFVAIWEADEGDAFADPVAWQKANPNLGVSVFEDFLRNECKKAQAVASKRAEFETKHLNRWVTSSNPWISLEAWDACFDPNLFRESFKGRDCYAGLDLASKKDLAATAYVFPESRTDGTTGYAIFVDSYLNDLAVSDGRNASYTGWAEDGLLTVTVGDVTDFAYIERDVIKARDVFTLRQVGFDPYQGQYMAQNLNAAGLETVEVRQGPITLSEPMKEFEALVMQKRVRHDGNPVLRWCVSNTLAKYDSKGNVKPEKEKDEQKIDAVSALLNAMVLALRAPAPITDPTQILSWIDFDED
jgi:phage terminase large subunit-like protein